ncbi:amino acid permease-domain-containing protein [Peziza echinospora]|nr:amino acid permease-domain-containing protein [Peziza echinospora]
MSPIHRDQIGETHQLHEMHGKSRSDDGDDDDEQIYALPERTDAIIEEARKRAQETGSMFQDHSPQVKKLGIFSTSCVIMNRMIGTGIFETPARIWKGSGSPGAALLMWTLGTLITYAGLTVYMELGLTIPRYLVKGQWRSVPRSGGEKNYLEFLYKKPKFLATCLYAVIFIFLGNTAGNAIVFSNYFLQMIGYPSESSTDRNWTTKGIAVIVITVACLLHGSWRSGGIWTNNTFAVVKVGILWFFIISGLYTYSGNVPKVPHPGESLSSKDSKNFNSNVAYLTGFGVHGWMTVLLDVNFSFGGFENAHYILSEVKKPKQRLKYSTFGALSLVSLSYLLTNIAYFTVVTAEDMDPKTLGNRTISMVFFEKIFYGNEKAQRALPALIAISAFGNIINATFVSSKVKQEIAKEGILPFSDFWRSEYRSPFSRLRQRFSGGSSSRHEAPVHPHPHHPHHHIMHRRSHQRITELTPMPALLLHWLTSLIIILAPPSGDEYTIFTGLYAYMTLAWFGVFLAGGLLYVGYYKPYRFQRAASGNSSSSSKDANNQHNTYNTNNTNAPTPGYRWRKIAGFTPWFGPVLPALYFCSCIVIVVGRWIPEPSKEKSMSSTGIAWYVVPTVGMGLVAIGVGYWSSLTYLLPVFWNKRLRVRRTPYLDVDLNFRYEEVHTAWLDEGASDDEEEVDPDLQD